MGHGVFAPLPEHQSTGQLIRVSIVVPAYNAAGTIACTLDSVLAQSHAAWHAVVVDDGSTDETGRIVAEYALRDPRITLVRQANGGESAARNAGIAQAAFEWLLFLDADDWIAPAYLARMTDALRAEPLLDAVHCGYTRVAADGSQSVEPYEPPTGDLFPVLARRSAFPVHACVVRTALVRDVGLFDTTLKTSPDWDLWQRIARTGATFGAVREVLAFYRMSPASASLDARQVFTDGLRLLKQGLVADPRVPRAHPAYAAGLADGRLETQEFYLLCWCAGLALGTGRDARPLLELVGDHRFPDLWAPAVAQCLFESIPLPACLAPAQWERIWPGVRQRLSDFLAALEHQTGAQELARKADAQLRRMIADSSPTLNLLRDELLAVREPLDELRAELEHLRQSVGASDQARAQQTESRADELVVLRAEMARLRDLAAERHQALAKQQHLISELTANQTLLTEAHDRWRALAEERERSIATHAEALARQHQLLADERDAFEQIAKRHAAALEATAAQQTRLEAFGGQLAAEREGRLLVEQYLQGRNREVAALDALVRERDEALREKLDVIAALQVELGTHETREQHLADELHRERAALQRGALLRQHLEETIEWSKRELERARAAHESLRSEAAALGQRSGDADARTVELERRLVQEAQALRAAPEWRVGSLLWNTARLSHLGTPVARLARRTRGRRTREALASVPRAVTSRAHLEVNPPARRAVVAACWNFPISSQTFVYQEVQGLEWAGFDYRFFCCEAGAREGLPAAFQGVWEKHVVLKSDWEINRDDLAHFVATCPERVDSLLARLGAATGLSREEVLQQSIVMTGFTFARHVQLFGADYLHTYFFYDQSFMGLMAGWLLGIPRGITAYADHMLNDYQFKLVALQIELADVVVATSARIKTELSSLSGGRFDDKIIVKPNGVNTERFPYVPAATRLAEQRQPELVSVSRIEPKKGLIHLVDAISLLEQRGVHVRLNLVGGVDQHTPSSAECHRELVARIAELGLGERVILHGPKQQAEFIPIMARSHAFVAPYVEVSSGDKDGIPTAVLEAMSCGLPIVATDAGSITEAVAHDVEALVVPQRDAAALADAIAAILTDRARYVRMSDAARRRATSEFDAHVTERTLHDRIATLFARRVA